MPLLALLVSFSTHAQSTIRGPMSSAMAGTGRAGLQDLEGVFLNPAQMALLKNHSIGAYYRDGGLDDGQHRQFVGLGAGDNGTNVIFPGALHYFRMRDTGRAERPVSGELWHMAGADFITKGVAMGISGYRLNYKMEGRKDILQWNGSAGLIWMITEELGVAYTLSNILRVSDGVPVGLRERMEQGIGIYAEVAEIANLRFDMTRHESGNPDRKLAYMASFESMSGKFAVFRTDYRLDDEANQRFYTVGMGFNGPRLRVDYSFEKNIKGTSEALHSVDLRLPF